MKQCQATGQSHDQQQQQQQQPIGHLWILKLETGGQTQGGHTYKIVGHCCNEEETGFVCVGWVCGQALGKNEKNMHNIFLMENCGRNCASALVKRSAAAAAASAKEVFWDAT